MRILEIHMPRSQDGLDDLHFYGLGREVVLAGPNGSGKSRILRRLEADVRNYLGSHEAERLRTERARLLTLPPNQQAKLHQIQARLDAHDRIRTDHDNIINAIAFTPHVTSFDDPAEFGRNKLDEAGGVLDFRFLLQNSRATLLAIQSVQDSYFNLTHPELGRTLQDTQPLRKQYERLNALCFEFLGERLGRNEQGLATLFDRPLAQAQMSNGQVILLQLAAALVRNPGPLRNDIIIIDEPENYLHPAALRSLLGGVRKLAPECQFWIATHSLNVLAMVDPVDIWFVAERRATRAGRNPERVLRSLLGDAGEIDRMHDFLGLPSRLATIRFAQECLTGPIAVGPGQPADPQLQMISDHVQRALATHGTVRLLDFGCGRGRLPEALFLSEDDERRAAGSLISYCGYEPDNESAAACELMLSAVGRVNGAPPTAVVCRDFEELVAQSKRFDVLVLCNVLHEIEPSEWPCLFGPAGRLVRALSDDGVALIVEDHELSRGENAHQFGFLVLDEPELRILFAVGDADSYEVTSLRDGRVKAHGITAACLARASLESVRAAVDALGDRSMKMVASLRAEPGSYAIGRKLAYWALQHSNARLASEGLART